MTYSSTALLATALAIGLTPAPLLAKNLSLEIDPEQSRIVISFDHFGFSATKGMFSGIEGQIAYNDEYPARSSVKASLPVDSLHTGWMERTSEILSPDYLDARKHPEARFRSTSIEIIDDRNGLITGDLTLNGVTQEVVLDAHVRHAGMHPVAARPAIGFEAITTISRTDFGMGFLTPFVSDDVVVDISIEALAPALR